MTGREYERQEIRRSADDWVIARVEDDQFRAACGPLNLDEALHLFRRWAEAEHHTPTSI